MKTARYTLHAPDKEFLAQADTAQEIVAMALPGTIAVDHEPYVAYPYVLFVEDVMGIVGVPYYSWADAVRSLGY